MYQRVAVSIFALLSCLVHADKINFNRDVHPILADRCFHCHGPDENKRKGKLRLDVPDGDHGAYRVIDGVQGIKPGDLKASEVWFRLVTDDEDDLMPPLDSHKQQLTPDERTIIKQWIEQGAKYEKFWAFVPPRKVTPPTVADADWNKHPVDQFIRQQLQDKDATLAPKPTADKRTLIRRLSFDLTGLPPTPAEIAAFLADKRPDAYDRLVERLLAKPQYGEHMARYWLDLVRFADTNGIHHDHFRDMHPYRSWVIRAFNDNLPYDQFVHYQLAGDLYPEPTNDQLIASGFNRLHLIIDRGTMLPEESFTRNVTDRVTAVGTAFMGMTVQCAVCHDHKYDPLTMTDFYQLTAFFNNIDAAPETGRRSGTDFLRGLQPPYVTLGTDAQKAELARLESTFSTAQKQVGKLRNQHKQEKDPQAKKQLAAQLKKAEAAVNQARHQRNEFSKTIPAAMVMKERAEVRPAHFLIRGQYDNPGKVVQRDTPGFLPPLRPAGDLPTRMDLAKWFTRADNPLTARVAVNRFWQQFFGVGIVKTAEDLGAQGEPPSHPELLDHLTVRFVESGWDVKALVRHLVTSRTYQQSSAAPAAEFTADPENRLLARGARFRMDAEMIRDQILATSGLLNPDMYGPSVKVPQPAGIWKAVTLPDSYPRTFSPSPGDEVYRRSVYTFWKRGLPPPQMTILNAPAREECIARRERTNTPLQALLLFNETEYFKAARTLAQNTLAGPPCPPEERLDRMYEIVTSQIPDADERQILLATFEDLLGTYKASPELARDLCGDAPIPAGQSPAQLAAWTVVANALYNLDETKTRE